MTRDRPLDTLAVQSCFVMKEKGFELKREVKRTYLLFSLLVSPGGGMSDPIPLGADVNPLRLVLELNLQRSRVCPQTFLMPPKYVEIYSDRSMSTLASIAASWSCPSLLLNNLWLGDSGPNSCSFQKKASTYFSGI